MALPLRPSAALPTSFADGIDVPARATKYGELLAALIGGAADSLADEGSLHLATSPTPGTGIASLAAPTAHDLTKPFLMLNNAHASKRLRLHWIKLICTAAGTAGASLNYSIQVSGVNPARYTSAGSTLTPVCPNTGQSNDSTTVIKCGALVAVAPTTETSRLLGHGVIRTVIPVIGDTYLLNFAGVDNSLGGMVIGGTAAGNFVFPHAPVSIGPGEWFALQLWLPSQSAASSYEVEVCYSLR